MDENRIRQIIREEIAARSNATRFGFNNIPLHTHNGKDSPKVKQENVIPSASVMGDVRFEQVTNYRLNLNSSFTPSRIFVYGVITGTYLGGANRIMFFGSATNSPTFYFQPATETSVVTGNIEFPLAGKPAQSGSYISANRGSLSYIYAGVTEDHILSVGFPDPEAEADIRARATVTAITRNYIDIDIPYLESGWSIIMSFVVS